MFILFFIRVIILVMCIIGFVCSILLFLHNKNRSKLLKIIMSVICFCGVAFSICIPAKMFLAEKEYSPKYEMKNLDKTFKRFDKMYDYGIQQLSKQKPLNSFDGRIIFNSGDNFEYEITSTVFRYRKNDNSDDFVNDLKDSAVDSGEKNGIKFWRSNLSCSTLSAVGAFCGTGGSILLEDETGEILVIYYEFRNYDDSSNIFPSFPKEFTELSILSFDIESESLWIIE